MEQTLRVGKDIEMLEELIPSGNTVVMTFSEEMESILITSNVAIYVSFNADVIGTGASHYLANEMWSMDLACTHLAVQAIGSNATVRVQGISYQEWVR